MNNNIYINIQLPYEIKYKDVSFYIDELLKKIKQKYDFKLEEEISGHDTAISIQLLNIEDINELNKFFIDIKEKYSDYICQIIIRIFI